MNIHVDIEKHLVNAALQDDEARAEIFLKLKPEHFQDTTCQDMFGAALGLYLAGKPVDVFSAAKAGRVKEYHGFLTDFFIHSISVSAAIKALQGRHDRQRLEHRLNECLITLKRDEHADYDVTRAAVVEMLFKAFSDGAQDGETHPADTCLAMYEERKAAGGKLSGVPSGFQALDAEIGGLQPGTVTNVGGRTSHGKTTLVQDIIYTASLKLGIPCLYVSLEQPAYEVALFMLQKMEGICPRSIKADTLSTVDEFNLKNALKNLKGSPLYFYDRSSRLDDILLKARSMVHAKNIKLLIVDYIQLVENQIKGEPRHLQVAGVSRAFKRLAMDTGLAVVALSQLNRNPEERGGIIHLSDIRESDAIAHDADHIVFINRPSLYGGDDPDFLQLAKNRHGRTVDKIPVKWQAKRNTYLDLR